MRCGLTVNIEEAGIYFKTGINQLCVIIPLNSASSSIPKRPLVPIEIGHPMSERSDAGVDRSFTQKSI
jgi:hypothetical protein